MLLIIAFVFLLGSIAFFIISLICKIKDNGLAVKNVIRGVLFLILFTITMSFDEANVNKNKPDKEDNQIEQEK
ncbi:hypothetical protein AB4Y30_04960 [Ornithinibacillus sp. 4-3]|uniref:Uncharacterized protein n=1 Tax=Ornithinibacillus sp. 4-3 TaxID=3231488 RepID=A0AB39HT29_9BACI